MKELSACGVLSPRTLPTGRKFKAKSENTHFFAREKVKTADAEVDRKASFL
jgi:hypothetical protein